MVDLFFATLLRLFSWLVFAGFERRTTLVSRLVEPGSGHLYAYALPAFEHLADNDEQPSRSKLRLTEDGRPLRPAHILHADIVAKGGGRHSHHGRNLYFSASDNSDPRINGRAYVLSRTATLASFAAWVSGCISNPRWLPRVKRVAWRTYFKLWIDLKWRYDKRHLPLAAGHRELYDIIHRYCWREVGKFPDLICCRDFNDKIQWLKLFDQSQLIVSCMDKIEVRKYIQGRIGENYLVNLYQTHDHFRGIDFAALPNEFVIKANNDSGTVILVRDKFTFDHQAVERKVEAALGRHYGWSKGEWAYSHITPRVLVEEFIEPHKRTPPSDYKFYCSEGVVKVCRIVAGRGGANTTEQCVDPEGNDLVLQMNPAFTRVSDFRKPALWSEMIRVAEELSRGHKFVRIDLYCADERIYAGEMTFWPGGGAYPLPDQKDLGERLDFDRSTHKPLYKPAPS